MAGPSEIEAKGPENSRIARRKSSVEAESLDVTLTTISFILSAVSLLFYQYAPQPYMVSLLLSCLFDAWSWATRGPHKS